MSKYLMTLAAVLCCAMVSVLFTSCSKDDLHDVVRSQFLQVHERQGSKIHENEEVTDEGEVGILKLMRHHHPQFFFCKESTLLALGADVELRKHVALYLAVIMRTAYNSAT